MVQMIDRANGDIVLYLRFLLRPATLLTRLCIVSAVTVGLLWIGEGLVVSVLSALVVSHLLVAVPFLQEKSRQ